MFLVVIITYTSLVSLNTFSASISTNSWNKILDPRPLGVKSKNHYIQEFLGFVKIRCLRLEDSSVGFWWKTLMKRVQNECVQKTKLTRPILTMFCTCRNSWNVRNISYSIIFTKKKPQTYIIFSMHNLHVENNKLNVKRKRMNKKRGMLNWQAKE